MLEAKPQRSKLEQVMPGDGELRELTLKMRGSHLLQLPWYYAMKYSHVEDLVTSCACPRQAVHTPTLKSDIFKLKLQHLFTAMAQVCEEEKGKMAPLPAPGSVLHSSKQKSGVTCLILLRKQLRYHLLIYTL